MSDLISRQAAIKNLTDEYHGMISDESMKVYQIIDWLNLLPSAEKADDLISRQAVLDYLKANCDEFLDYHEAIEVVIAMPRAEKTGEWQQDMDGKFLCSECGSGFKEQPTLMGKPMFLYCPLCGAWMAESEE